MYIGDVPSVTVIPKLVPQVLPEEQEGDEGMSDSDSEGPILYKDDEDEEEDESHNSKALTLQLAAFFSLLNSCLAALSSGSKSCSRSASKQLVLAFVMCHMSFPSLFQSSTAKPVLLC